ARWTVRLPDCCVVCGCGDPSDRADEVVRTVDDLTWPLCAAASGLGAGLLLCFWSGWLLPVALFAGLALGYGGRRPTEVRLTLRRCQAHVDFVGVPQVRMVGSALLVRVGHPRVKTLCLQGASDQGVRPSVEDGPLTWPDEIIEAAPRPEAPVEGGP